MRDNLTDGWRLGGAALGFVLGSRALQRFVLTATTIVLAISAAVAVAAVLLRREAGPVGYALGGVGAYYCLSVMVTAVGVGVAGVAAEGSGIPSGDLVDRLAGDRAPSRDDRRVGA